jgi:hypothetical protein
MKNYFIKEGKVFRKQHFCKKTQKMRYEKELKIQMINGYEYVYIDKKLVNLEKVKIMLKR